MKKIILFAALSFLFTSFIFAHSPKEIKLSFNNETKVLKAEISHGSKDVNKHYIAQVKAALEGKEIIVQSVSAQREGNIQEFVFTVPDAGIGDTIKVRADCSIFGSRAKSIKVIKQCKAVIEQEKSGAKRIK